MTETESTPPPRIGWKMGVTGLLALGFIFYSMQGTDAEQPKPEDTGIPRHEAWGACQEAVKGELTNPATADFRILTTEDKKGADGGYDFSGALTAQNGFGVEENLVYSCDVTREGFVTVDVRTAD